MFDRRLTDEAVAVTAALAHDSVMPNVPTPAELQAIREHLEREAAWLNER